MGSLAHEGTSVTQGVKYVIRTDVLYMLPKKEPLADAPVVANRVLQPPFDLSASGNKRDAAKTSNRSNHFLNSGDVHSAKK